MSKPKKESDATKTGGLTPEEFCTNLFVPKVPPMKVNGNLWYPYKEGVWKESRRDDYFAIARAVIPDQFRTAKMVRCVLDNFSQRRHTRLDDMRGFYTFQGDAIVLNVANGLLTVKAEGDPELGKHTPEFAFTLKTPTLYLPNESSSPFDLVISQLLPDPLDQLMLDDWFGYILMPDCRYERAMCSYGLTGRGKSTIAEAIEAVLGPGIVTNIAMSLLCEAKSYYLHLIRFAAVNISEELSAKTIEDSAMWKALVSGASVEARPIAEAPENMRTACKHWCMSNNIPRFKNATSAEVRRMRFLHFCQAIERDPDVKRRIADNPSAVFNRMVRGLQGLLRRGKFSTGGQASVDVGDRFEMGNDPLGLFVKTRCRLEKDAFTLKSELQEAYDAFCDATDQPVWVKTNFYRRLKDSYPELRDVRSPREDDEKRPRRIYGIALLPEN